MRETRNEGDGAAAAADGWVEGGGDLSCVASEGVDALFKCT